MAKRIRTNNDLQTTQNTKDRVHCNTNATKKTVGVLRCCGRPRRAISSCSTSDTQRVTLVTNLVICIIDSKCYFQNAHNDS